MVYMRRFLYLPIFAKKVAENEKMIDFPFSILNFI